MPEVVTLGETMILMNPDKSGSLRYVNRFEKQIAGTESNVAVGLAHYGHSVGWISKLGNDEFGHYINSVLRGEGIDTSQVVFTDKSPTGVFFRERKKVGKPEVYYYRDNSAASTMSPEILDEEYFDDAKYLHLTGITPALSQQCYKTVKKAIKIAKEKNIKISFDPNIRFKLWEERKTCKILLEIMEKADILLPGLREAEILLSSNFNKSGKLNIGNKDVHMEGTVENKLNEPHYHEIAESFLNMGPELVVLKLGKKGVYLAQKNTRHMISGNPVEVIDPTGAGDAFAAGFLSGLLKGKKPEEAAKIANIIASFVVTEPGDYEALPDEKDIKALLENDNEILR